MQPLSVSVFIAQFNDTVSAYSVSIQGEISSYKINQGKWIFFDLKDEGGTLSCFMPAWQLHQPIQDGMQVVISGRPGLYAKTGKFSITVARVEIVGAGSLQLSFELLKKKLETEGLFAPERKRQLPPLPHHIGLIASTESAAYGDFLKILNERMGGIRISVAHTSVQGDSAVDSVLDAFQTLHTLRPLPELIVLIRGGGSLEDLQTFNTEPIARAIFSSPIPVVTGIGHERDVSIADLVADVRASTPSNAAELIVPHRRELIAGIDRATTEMYDSLLLRMDSYKRVVSRIEQWSRVAQEYIRNTQVRIDLVLQRGFNRVERVSESLNSHLAAGTATLKALHPEHVLKRGYALVRRGETVIRSAKSVRTNETLTVQFHDGTRKVTTQL